MFELEKKIAMRTIVYLPKQEREMKEEKKNDHR